MKLDNVAGASVEEFRRSLTEYYEGKLTAVEVDALSILGKFAKHLPLTIITVQYTMFC